MDFAMADEVKVVRPPVSDEERQATLMCRVGYLLNRNMRGVDVGCARDSAVRVSRRFYNAGLGLTDFVAQSVREDLESFEVPGRDGERLFRVGPDEFQRAGSVSVPVRTWSTLVTANEFTPTPMTDVEESELREQVTLFLPETAPVVQITRGGKTACVRVKRRMHEPVARLILIDIENAARRMGFAVVHSGVRVVDEGERSACAVVVRTA